MGGRGQKWIMSEKTSTQSYLPTLLWSERVVRFIRWSTFFLSQNKRQRFFLTMSIQYVANPVKAQRKEKQDAKEERHLRPQVLGTCANFTPHDVQGYDTFYWKNSSSFKRRNKTIRFNCLTKSYENIIRLHEFISIHVSWWGNATHIDLRHKLSTR